MVVQILSGIHLKKLFFSTKENPSLTGIWNQDPLWKMLYRTCSTIWATSLVELVIKIRDCVCKCFWNFTIGSKFIKSSCSCFQWANEFLCTPTKVKYIMWTQLETDNNCKLIQQICHFQKNNVFKDEGCTLKQVNERWKGSFTPN